MAYPDSGITKFFSGASYPSVKNYLTELDIAYSRTLGGDNNSFKLPEDLAEGESRELTEEELNLIKEK